MSQSFSSLLNTSASDPQQRNQALARLGVTLFLLVIVGIASLVIAQQILTGWLVLGERANISRRDLNPIEITVMLGTAIWGLICLWTVLGFVRHSSPPTIKDYFGGKHTAMSPGILLTIALLGVIGVITLVIGEQVLTGWLALGERVNISRRDINWVEWVTIAGTGIIGIISLRTVFGLITRDKRAWAWAQWVVLAVAIVGLTVLISGSFDLPGVLPKGGSIIDNLPGVQEFTAPGLLIFLSCIAVYRFMTMEVDVAPDTVIRNMLAKTPGAGAIVGFFALLIFFSLASDLFLEQKSIASLLATNITRGLVAIGITFLMISGEFDLSVGSVFGAGALVFLLMMTEGLTQGTLIGVPAIILGLIAAGWGWNKRSNFQIIAGLGAFILGLLAMASLQTIVITSVIPAMLIALAFAALLGYINGNILISTGIPSFIVTLGTLLAYRAILLIVVADGRILRYADYRLPPPYVYFNRYVLAVLGFIVAVVVVLIGYSLLRSAWATLRQRISAYRTDTSDFRDFFIFSAALRMAFNLVVVLGAAGILVSLALNQLSLAGTTSTLEISFFDLLNARFDFVASDVNLRIGVLWWLLLVLIFQFVLMQTSYGNHVFAVGGNPGAARAQGINVNRVKIMNFMICSMLACLAGIISVARLANVDPLMGDGLELEVIAASVIGGAMLTGGYGSIIGSLLGVLIFGMLQTGLVLIGVDSRAFSGVIGIIIIIAVVINTLARQARK
jgi:ribose/xylose/arabinose/galactoside ABC-type transport system permease subunit